MKSKTEQKLDAEFERMGVRPRIYHFTTGVAPFNAVTIIDNEQTWEGMEKHVNDAFNCEDWRLHGYYPTTRFIQALKSQHIYGFAVCNKRDQFNRQRGRIIAKGRLLKHLKEEAKQ